MNITCILLVLLFVSRGIAFGGAQAGVFQVLDSQTNQPSGSIFLIDRERGWFVTAAHVLAAAHTQANSQVSILWRYQTTFQNESRLYKRTLKLIPTASGFDFRSAEENRKRKNTVDDWAILELANRNDATLLAAFKQFVFLRDLTQTRIAAIRRPVEVLGFPSSGDEQLLTTGSLGPKMLTTGLWDIDAGAISGDSGGPVGIPDYSASQADSANISTQFGDSILLGVLLRKSDAAPTHSEFLPACTFLPEIAEKVPSSKEVANIMELLRAYQEAEDWDLQIEMALYRLDAVEHWQLIQSICKSADLSGSVATRFIWRFYAPEKFTSGFYALLKCRPEITVNLLKQSDMIIPSLKANGPPHAGADLARIELLSQAASVASDPQYAQGALRFASTDELSRLVTNSAYAYLRSFETQAVDDRLVSTIAGAAHIYMWNPDIGLTMALARKDLPRRIREELLADSLTIKTGSNVTGMISLLDIDSDAARFVTKQVTGKNEQREGIERFYASLEPRKGVSTSRIEEAVTALQNESRRVPAPQGPVGNPDSSGSGATGGGTGSKRSGTAPAR